MDSHLPVKKEYFGALDTLRFLAFFCVFVSHSVLFLGYSPANGSLQYISTYFLTQGNLGVTFFFVLSGFLITYLLYKEVDTKNGVSIRKFYVRRILRIWPVYFVVVLVGFFGIPFLLHHVAQILPFTDKDVLLFSETGLNRLPWYMLFIANFDMIINGSSAIFLAVLWSISVEEQFYLIWPWVIGFLKKNRAFVFLIAIMLVSFLYRLIHINNIEYLRYSTFSVLSDLATGGLAAYLITHFSKVKEYISSMSRKVGLLFLICIPAVFWLNKTIEIISFNNSSKTVHIIYALIPQFVAVFFALIILFTCFNTTAYIPRKVSDITEYFGRISYGLYCYHCLGIFLVKIIFLIPVFVGLNGSVFGFVTSVSVAFATTLLLSSLSYKYMEKPVLRLKKRFEV